MSKRNFGLAGRRPLWDNNHIWPARAFLVLEILLVIDVGVLVLTLAGGLR
jgi:hypothetical protein